jgi:hypothetical protein
MEWQGLGNDGFLLAGKGSMDDVGDEARVKCEFDQKLGWGKEGPSLG